MAALNSNPPLYNPIYFGPGPGPIGRCNDRSNGKQTGYPLTRPAAACTSTNAGQINARPTGLPGVMYNPDHAQLRCIDGRHQRPCTVCFHCNSMYKNSQWYRSAYNRITRRPPLRGNEPEHWRGFLTRMCTLCEEREQYLVASRRAGGGGIPALGPTNAQRQRMEDYPSNTCTCLSALQENRRLCRTHRSHLHDSLTCHALIYPWPLCSNFSSASAASLGTSISY